MEEREDYNPVQILKSLKDTELDLDIVLMRRDFPIGRLVSLTPGNTLVFDHPQEDPAEIVVNGKSFAKGNVVQVGDNYGIEVKELS